MEIFLFALMTMTAAPCKKGGRRASRGGRDKGKLSLIADTQFSRNRFAFCSRFENSEFS
jgi:hypothetical protein